MAEGDGTNNDAAEATTGGTQEGRIDQPTSGAEASGTDPAGFEPSGVGDPANEGEGSGSRPGDWNPGEQSGGGGELY
ncbi:MAG: hypothetical protein ACJ754_09875 [Pyrinomonadaceae bacterium]